MSLTNRLVNALRRTPLDKPPRIGRVIQPRAEDSLRDYPSSGLTPSRMMSILREADAGDPSSAMQLFAEMEEKDPHLYAVANTRRLALTGLEWQVVSASDIRAGVDRKMADDAAEFCRQTLGRLDGFDEALQHLSLAFGRNISIVEIVWDLVGGELTPVELCPLAFGRIVFDEVGEPRVLTADEPRDGISLAPNKFIVHVPHSVGGHPAQGGLLRVSALTYLGKNMALKDWLIFAEVFGMPVRIARYEPSASAEEKRELLDMLESLGAHAAGIFSRAVELQFIEANRGTIGPPYENLVDFLNREMSKAWLGQTLTTETVGESGTFAASKVHDDVRRDLRNDDIRKEGRTIRRDLLAPICRMRFGPDVPVPFFRRRVGRPSDLKELADVLDRAINRLGARVPASWAHEVLGIPEAAPDEPMLAGAEASSVNA